MDNTKSTYETPIVEILEVEAEKGFLISNGTTEEGERVPGLW